MQPSCHLGSKEITEGDHTQFRAVLSCVWDVDEMEANDFGEESTHVIVFSASIKTWDQAQPVDWGIKQVRFHIRLLGCTVMAAFSARFQYPQALIPSQGFQDMMITCLGEALTRAGESLKQDNSRNLKDIIEELANLVSRVGSEVPDQLRTLPPLSMGSEPGNGWQYWDNIQKNWLKDVFVLENRLGEVSTSLAVPHSDSTGKTG
ncbi:hypothetical protein DFH08DRAFT_814968 [Mycena albidolilacea]|uniref:Uncharacterized protein n=1 Tax=Mycena albidolilacea TaxID=1033008 RepID=A0AAD6ZN63_9AGAR|nr:hypothetical protein DFH08DRAFT_814968 [Mycena albidolilacea]